VARNPFPSELYSFIPGDDDPQLRAAENRKAHSSWQALDSHNWKAHGRYSRSHDVHERRECGGCRLLDAGSSMHHA